jgi:hypothetical protein
MTDLRAALDGVNLAERHLLRDGASDLLGHGSEGESGGVPLVGRPQMHDAAFWAPHTNPVPLSVEYRHLQPPKHNSSKPTFRLSPERCSNQ